VDLKYFLQLRKLISMLLLKKKHCYLCYRFIETTLTVALLPFDSRKRGDCRIGLVIPDTPVLAILVLQSCKKHVN